MHEVTRTTGARSMNSVQSMQTMMAPSSVDLSRRVVREGGGLVSRVTRSAMKLPNGDPPPLMLWGVEGK